MEQQRYICQMIEKIDEQITALNRMGGTDIVAPGGHLIKTQFLIEVLSKAKRDYQSRVYPLPLISEKKQ